MDIHLPGQYRTSEVVDEDLNDVNEDTSKLEAFFNLVQYETMLKDRDPTFNARSLNLKYAEIPKYYTWHKKDGEFRPEGRHTEKIGRIYFVRPENMELFYLRYLILLLIMIFIN